MGERLPRKQDVPGESRTGRFRCFQLTERNSQGSVISPVLFLIAINDFPDLERGVQKSIFADDSAIWKTGGSLELTTKQVQSELTKIEGWCARWGFNLSVDKTVGMVFCEVGRPDETTIKLQGQNIKLLKKTKFLGMVLDNQMSWRNTSSTRRTSARRS